MRSAGEMVFSLALMADAINPGTAPAPVSTPAAPSASSTPATPSAPTTPSTTAVPENGGAAAPATPAADTRTDQEIIAAKLREGFKIDDKGNDLPAEGNEGEQFLADAEPAAAAAPAAAEGDADQFADFTTDVISPIGARDLAAKVASDPAIQAALEANPELKNQVFANARLAERATKYDAILGSPDEAQIISEGYTQFSGLQEHLESVVDGKFETMTPFFEAMKQATALRDEDGNVLKDAQGNIRTTGVFGALLKNAFHEQLEVLSAQARREGNDDALAALDTVMERAGLREPSIAHEDEPEDLKAQRTALAEETKAMESRKEAQFKHDLQASDARVDSKTDMILDGALKTILSKATGLDDYTRGTVESAIRKELSAVIRASKIYNGRRATIERAPLGPKREAEVVKLNTQFVNDRLEGICRSELSKAGVSISTKAQQRHQDRTARETAARSENRGSLAPVAPGATASDNSSVPKVMADLKTKLGREPDTQEIIVEQMLRRRAEAAAR